MTLRRLDAPNQTQPTHREDTSGSIDYEKQPAEALADIAPTLKEAELRVLLELTRRQLRGVRAVKVSSRELATSCKIARSKIVPAIDSLTARGYITSRQGTPTTPATYMVNILETIRMGGPQKGPPQPPGWSPKETAQVPLWDHSGPETGPPPTEKSALARAAAASDFDATALDLIDRVFSAKGKSLDRETLARFRGWMHGHMAKFGRNPDGIRWIDYPQSPLSPPTALRKAIARSPA